MKRYTIDEFKADYPTNDACLDKLFKLRFENLVCPKCESDRQFKRIKDRRCYGCPNCGYQIYPTKGTIFEKTTTPLLYWFHAIYLQTTTRNGVAAKELERQLNICYKTALRMAHQIKILMAKPMDKQIFGGIVEMDESLIGGKLSYKHLSVRKELMKDGHNANRNINKTNVFGMVERKGKALIKVIPAATKEHVVPIINKHVEYATIIMTDTSTIYSGLNYDHFHQTVNHKIEEYVRGNVYTNSIEGLWSQLKRTIRGTHIHVSAKHLQKYANEVAFRYTYKNRQDEMFNAVLSYVV